MSHKSYIAISFRGMLRTWDKCKSNIFTVFKELEQNYCVVYFVDTWDKQLFQQFIHDADNKTITEISRREIKAETLKMKLLSDFSGKKIVLTFHSSDPADFNAEAYSKICYLNSLSVSKYEIENNIKFDFSVNLRTDLWFEHPEHVSSILMSAVNKNPKKWMISDLITNDSDVYDHFPVSNIFNRLGGPMAQDQFLFGPTDLVKFVDDHYFRRSMSKYNVINAHHDLGLHMREYSIPSNDTLPFCSILVRDFVNIELEKQPAVMHDWHLFKRINIS